MNLNHTYVHLSSFKSISYKLVLWAECDVFVMIWLSLQLITDKENEKTLNLSLQLFSSSHHLLTLQVVQFDQLFFPVKVNVFRCLVYQSFTIKENKILIFKTLPPANDETVVLIVEDSSVFDDRLIDQAAVCHGAAHFKAPAVSEKLLVNCQTLWQWCLSSSERISQEMSLLNTDILSSFDVVLSFLIPNFPSRIMTFPPHGRITHRLIASEKVHESRGAPLISETVTDTDSQLWDLLKS